jgi:hypothetical protein
MKKILIATLLAATSFNSMAEMDMTMPPGPHQQMKRIMFNVTVPPATVDASGNVVGSLVKTHGELITPIEGATVWTAIKMCVVDVSPFDKFSAQTWIRNMDINDPENLLNQYYFSHSVNTWGTELCSTNEQQPTPIHFQHNIRPSLKCINYDTKNSATCHVRMYLLAK